MLTLLPNLSPLEIIAPKPTHESLPIIVLPPQVDLEAIKHLSPIFTPCSI